MILKLTTFQIWCQVDTESTYHQPSHDVPSHGDKNDIYHRIYSDQTLIDSCTAPS